MSLSHILGVWCTAVLLVLFTNAAASGFVKTGASGDSRQLAQSWYMVIDRASILDQGQERSAINDAWRLDFEGIPTQVITENAALNQNQADARARELRISHGIESSPGADDGLLVYASVNPYDRDSIVMSISTGSMTLPKNGLNATSLANVRESVMAPQLAAGHPARAIVYSLREIAYLEQYVPPAVRPVTGWRATIDDVLAYIGPVVALVGGAWLSWTRAQRAMSGLALAGTGVFAGALAILAVSSQSAIGVISAIVLGTVVIWQAITLDRVAPQSTVRNVQVTPRPPGTRSRTTSRPRVSPR